MRASPAARMRGVSGAGLSTFMWPAQGRRTASSSGDDRRGMVTARETASGIRVGGLAAQITGTAGLNQLTRDGLKYVRLLRPLISEKLKNEPALQAAWKM